MSKIFYPRNTDEWKCEVCKNPGHYTSTDGLGYWRQHCDEHDPRDWFQEGRRLLQKIEATTIYDPMCICGCHAHESLDELTELFQVEKRV